MTDHPQTNAMLVQLGIAYGAPRKEPAESLEFIALYARMLRQYTDSELNEAAERLLTGRDKRLKSWPSVAECSAVCEAARASIRIRMAAGENRERLDRLRPQEATPYELAEAREFVDGVADGVIPLFVDEIAMQEARERQPQRRGLKTVGEVVDYRLLAKRLREMAQAMQARRRGRSSC